MDNFIVIEGAIYSDSRLTSTDIIVYGIIASLTNNYDHHCYASNSFIAEKRGLSERQVQRSIAKLRQLNYLVVSFERNKRYIYTYLSKKIKERSMNNNLDIFQYDWLNDNNE